MSLNETKGSDDGEIFSDDEEAAYYPQHVKSRPQATEVKKSSKMKQSDAESQKSDSESLLDSRSRKRSKDRYKRDRHFRSSPESESDSTHQNRSQRSDSKEQLFYEDRDGSETESTGSTRERTRSRSRERDRDHRSSPKYGSSRNRNRERDRDRDRGNRSRNEDDSSDDRDQQHRGGGSSYYSRQSGGYGRTRGGYGGYQQRGSYGSSKYQVGGASVVGGGYTSSVQPGLMNTGMTAQQFHVLASKVKKRREDGLPLLPQPNLDKCSNLDQYNYPAPASWYLEEVEAWEKREREKEEEEKTKKMGGAVTESGADQAAGTRVDVKETVVEMVTEVKRPLSPALLRRTSSIALEIVSSPVSDDEPTLEVIEDESKMIKDAADTSSEVTMDATLDPETNAAELKEADMSLTESRAPLVVSNGSSSTCCVRPLKELAAKALEAYTEQIPSTTTVATATTAIATAAMATTSIAVSVTTFADTMTAASTTTTTVTTESATRSQSNPSISTAAPLQLPAQTPDSAQLSEEAPPTKPTLAPLTISTEPMEVDSDHSHSPSLSPTIPIQSGGQMKGAPSLHPKAKGVFRPKIMSDSDSEGGYDDYLDQLDEEEDDVITENSTSLLANTLSEGFPLISGTSAPSLSSLFEAGDKAKEVTNQVLGSVDDPFSEDFPAIGKSTEKSSSNQLSLMSLIGQKVNEDANDRKTQGLPKLTHSVVYCSLRIPCTNLVYLKPSFDCLC